MKINGLRCFLYYSMICKELVEIFTPDEQDEAELGVNTCGTD
jgi:hypothetical protein